MMEETPLTQGWEFRRLDTESAEGDWTLVELPHTPFVAGLDGENHWFGLVEYRRRLGGVRGAEGARVRLHLGAAMSKAEILLDGRLQGTHTGGYLPFEIELTDGLADGADHELLVRLDNRGDPDVPPGKPFGELDFCWYGGLYRGASLRVYPPLHITDPLEVGEPQGGGILLRTLQADTRSARLHARVHVANTGTRELPVRLLLRLGDAHGNLAAAESSARVIPQGGSAALQLELEVLEPRLWSPESPHLYVVTVQVLGPANEVLDERRLRTGLRRLAFSRSGGLQINGQRRRLRGTNRHQEFPRAGYAAGASAERRDARRIKEAGFDYVRLSHYPQSPAFLDACDELGILVMNAIPGWQFLGGPAFREACYRNARDLVRLDRNHPCVALWELSLNETQMDDEFMSRLHQIGHEEYPGDQLFTCGWLDAYDVYIHSRQHGGIHTWQNGDKALVVAEYGDWEFYASNHGFDQTTGAGVHDHRSNARQRRRDGERALLQQARNHILALNDTLSSPAVLDGQWCMFDYARGYHPDRAACGVMDLHRLPKFSYHFYRSQRHPSEKGSGWTGGPELFIASHWTPASDLRVTVFSNCEEVALSLNGRSVGRNRPAVTWMTQALPHPPFVFDLPHFASGTLEATGYIGGVQVAHHQVRTPGHPEHLALELDTAGIPSSPGSPDTLLVHARILDAAGTLCVDSSEQICFSVEGGATLLGPETVTAEAGIASVVLRRPSKITSFQIRANSTGLVGTTQTWA